MHEMMVAENLLAAISDEAAKRDAKPIGAKISCGMLYAINDEALCFAFKAISQDTPCEGLKLQIEHKSLQGLCMNCNQNFYVELSQPRCSKCGCEDFKLLPDAPLMLEEIEFQTE